MISLGREKGRDVQDQIGGATASKRINLALSARRKSRHVEGAAPSCAFSVDVDGWFCPEGHSVR